MGEYVSGFNIYIFLFFFLYLIEISAVVSA